MRYCDMCNKAIPAWDRPSMRKIINKGIASLFVYAEVNGNEDVCYDCLVGTVRQYITEGCTEQNGIEEEQEEDATT